MHMYVELAQGARWGHRNRATLRLLLDDDPAQVLRTIHARLQGLAVTRTGPAAAAAPEASTPWHGAHVTLGLLAADAPADVGDTFVAAMTGVPIRDVAWTVDRVCLYSSSGSKNRDAYTILHEYLLQ